jgi:type IV secretory pathway protease TraF
VNRAKAADRSLGFCPPSRWRWLVRGLGAAALLASIFGLQFLRFVLTPSLPRGLYWALPRRGHFQPGDLVAFCPPPAIGGLLLARHLVAPGLCPGGSVPLAKRIAAVGAFVCAGPSGVALDGYRVPWPVLPKSLALPRYAWCGLTSVDCAFVLGEGADSLDSRIFGCVPTGALQYRLLPLLTEGHRR